MLSIGWERSGFGRETSDADRRETRRTTSRRGILIGEGGVAPLRQVLHRWAWVDPIGPAHSSCQPRHGGALRARSASAAPRTSTAPSPAARRGLPSFSQLESRANRAAGGLIVRPSGRARTTSWRPSRGDGRSAIAESADDDGHRRLSRQAIETLEEYEFETRLGDNIVRREPIGVVRADLALELADPAPLQQARLGLRRGLHRWCSSRASSRRSARSCWPKSCTRPACRRACSTWSTATARRSATRSAPIPTSTWCRSPARRARASWWRKPRPRPSSGSARSSAASRPTSCCPMRTCEAAARWNIARGFSNTGQSCHSPTRILVHEDQIERVARAAGRRSGARCASAIRSDPATTMGPVVNKAQFERIQQLHRRSASRKAARLVCGGPGRPDGLDARLLRPAHGLRRCHART